MQRVDNITDFPNEILLLIFEYLLPSDRRIASECCKKFLEIWLREMFIDDRRIVFDVTYCYFKKRMENLSILLQSERKYKHLSVTGSSLFFQKDVFELLEPVFIKLGATVTTLELNKRTCPSSQFWKMFPNLKEVKITGVSPAIHFEYLPDTLELLILDQNTGLTERPLKALSDYLSKTVSAVKIELDGCNLSDVHSIFEHKQLERIITIGFFDSIDWIQCPITLTNLKHLKILFHNVLPKESNDILNKKFPVLERIKMRSTSIPLNNNDNLKHLEIRSCLSSDLPRLSIFKNLEILYLTIRKSKECFFCHESFLLDKVKELNIYLLYAKSQSSCSTCFAAMASNFPNLEKLYLSSELKNDHLEIIKDNLLKLTALKFSGSDRQSLNFHHLPNLSELDIRRWAKYNVDDWPLMLHLRKLTIEFERVSETNMEIFTKWPALEELSIKFEQYDSDEVLTFIENMVKPLKRLRKLNIWFGQFVHVGNVMEVVEEHCKYIKNITHKA